MSKDTFVFPLDLTSKGYACQDGLSGCYELGALTNVATFGTVYVLKATTEYSGYQTLRKAGLAQCSYLDSGQKVVIFAEELLQKCGVTTVVALLLHELGHHACGHITLEEVSSYELGTILNVPESEADDFAIAIIGKDAMKGAFLNMALAFFGYNTEEAIAKFLEFDPPRFQKLFEKK